MPKTVPTDSNNRPTEASAPNAPVERVLSPAAQRALAEAEARRAAQAQQDRAAQRELGGRNGPEPTRYGDWEKGGIISDF